MSRDEPRANDVHGDHDRRECGLQSLQLLEMPDRNGWLLHHRR
jgi:hypothetical protein